MELKTIKFSSFGLDPKLGLKDYSLLNNPINTIRLKNILENSDIEKGIKSGRTPSKFNEDYWNGEYDFLTMQDVDRSIYGLERNSSEKITETAIEEEKTLYQVSANALIISNAMTVGLAFITDRPIYLNQNVFHLVIDESKYSKVFLKWYFNLVFRVAFDKTFTSKYLSKDEFGRLKLPEVEFQKQKQIESRIIQLESDIQKLKSKIRSVNDIINEVFILEFGWDINSFERLKKISFINDQFRTFANNTDIRFSYKFHNKAGEYITEVLKKQSSKRIKDFLAEDITLGKSISPSDYDKTGSHYYVSMADIKNWEFNKQEAKTISQSYYAANSKKRIASNDIIMARSGEGTIGKVAIIDGDEEEGVYADFTMRIRLKDYNTTFAYYYFRTDYFQHLIYTHKKGLGNNTNIFPNQIREFPIPEVCAGKQDSIVEKIKSTVSSQRTVTYEIEVKQNEIKQIIEEVIVK